MRIKTSHILRPVLTALCLLTAVTISAAPGDLDPTFGSGGIVISSITNSPYYDAPRSMLVQPDGKIVVCGEILQDPVDPDDDSLTISFFIARYNSNGTLDTSFGTNGRIVAPFNSSDERVGTDIALQPDGKILAIGYSGNRTAVNRYDPDGTLDASFGTGGKVITQVGIGSAAYSVAVQPDGKIVVVGNGSSEPGIHGFAVVRYNPNGSLDTSFGEGGKLITLLGDRYGYALAAMVQPNGKIVVVGNTGGNGSYDEHFALVRYNADGSLDPGFGVGGKVVPVFLNKWSDLKDAVLQPDGRIIIVGTIGWALSVARYNANGSVDTSFAPNGIFTLHEGYWPDGGIALQRDGKIVSFLTSRMPMYAGPAVLRLDTNGSPDMGFGSNGLANTNFQSSHRFCSSGAVQQDGRILLLGYTLTGDGRGGDITIARFQGDPVAPGPVTLSGRVTTPDGRGLRNATVTLTDPPGMTRTATTGSFGSFTIDNVLAGEAYVISVTSKRFRFSPMTIQVNGNISNIEIIGQE